MIKVAAVRFKTAGKIYYFDPGDIDIKKNMNVIVETARGQEFGTAVDDVKEVDDGQIVAPLKPVVRIATEEDEKTHIENLNKKEEVLEICRSKIKKHNLDMKLIDVEHTFDNTKVIFYFTSEGRVDFRELVKELASVFRMRIELRQIGIRDEAKMMGGIGTCGRSLCCHSWLPEFQPVSIKMAKVQNLSLNPTKISGICGRLMCCLKYENDIYLELRKGMPDVGEKVKTEKGVAVVTDTNTLENKIKVRLVLEAGKGEDEDKLSDEVYVYQKQEIKRLSHGKKKDNKDILEEVDKEMLDEMKKLMKE